MKKEEYLTLKESQKELIKEMIIALLWFTFSLVVPLVIGIIILDTFDPNAVWPSFVRLVVMIGPMALLTGVVFKSKVTKIDRFIAHNMDFELIKHTYKPITPIESKELFYHNIIERAQMRYQHKEIEFSIAFEELINRKHRLVFIDQDEMDMDSLTNLIQQLEQENKTKRGITLLLSTDTASLELKDFLDYEMNAVNVTVLVIMYVEDTRSIHYKKPQGYQNTNKLITSSLDYKTIFGASYKELKKMNKENTK